MKPTNYSSKMTMEQEKKREKEKAKKNGKKKKRRRREIVANPVFEKILMSYYRKARAAGNEQQYKLALAFKSLYYCPITFKTPAECLILLNFSQTICTILDNDLKKKDCQELESNLQGPEKQVAEFEDVRPEKTKKPATSSGPTSSKEEIPTTLKNQEQSIAILQALRAAKNGNMDDFVTLKVLKQLVSTDLDYFKISSVISELTSEGLVSQLIGPLRYGITDKGISVLESHKGKATLEKENEDGKHKRVNEDAKLKRVNEDAKLKRVNEDAKLKKLSEEAKLKKLSEEAEIAERNEETKPKRRKEEPKISAKASSSKSTENESFDQVVLEPHSFDVILLVDTQETNSKSKDGSETTEKLERLKTRFSVQHLNVSDFAWIARCRTTQRELTLPFVVERKRVDDLSGSIKDGRYHEQKFRLKRCGIQNIVYLVEGMNSKVQTGIPLSSLQQATVNSLVQDGFSLKFTRKHTDSMKYLSRMTTVLYNQYKDKRLVSCKKSDLDSMTDTEDTKHLMLFEEFNKASTKNKVVRVKEMFVRQLAQLKGLSIDKALEITKVYPTPSLLKLALLEEGEQCLSSLKVNNRKLGDSVSRSIYQLYTQDTLN